MAALCTRVIFLKFKQLLLAKELSKLLFEIHPSNHKSIRNICLSSLAKNIFLLGFLHKLSKTNYKLTF